MLLFRKSKNKKDVLDAVEEANKERQKTQELLSQMSKDKASELCKDMLKFMGDLAA